MIGVFLGATERLVHAQRHPRIALVDVVSDHHRVHDRVDLGTSVIVLLDLGVVRKQPAHLGGAAAEGERIVRGHHEVDLAALEQVAALALEVGGRLDPLAGVDEEVAVTEDPRRKCRDGHERRLASAHQRGVVRQRHFRDLELVELQHAPENVGRLRGDVIELDALGLHRPVAERERAVVGTAGKCETQLAHRLIPRTVSPTYALVGNGGNGIVSAVGTEGARVEPNRMPQVWRLISIMVLWLLGLAFQATAETYPERVVRIVNPYPPGGSVDVMARILAQKLTDDLGQQVIVENRSGGGGNTGSDFVAKAEPDGYTLLFTAPGPLTVNQTLYSKLSFDPA